MVKKQREIWKLYIVVFNSHRRPLNVYYLIALLFYDLKRTIGKILLNPIGELKSV